MSFWDELESIKSGSKAAVTEELNKVNNQTQFLMQNITGADNVEEIVNLGNSVNRITGLHLLQGISRDENPISELYNDKKDAFINTKNAYAEGLDYINLYTTDEGKAKLDADIANMSWTEAMSKKLAVDKLQEDIKRGKAHGYIHKGKYASSSFDDILQKTETAYDRKMDFKNPEIFNIQNEDGTVNQDTAELLDKMKYLWFIGDEQQFNKAVNDNVVNSKSGYLRHLQRFNYLNGLYAAAGGDKAFAQIPVDQINNHLDNLPVTNEEDSDTVAQLKSFIQDNSVGDYVQLQFLMDQRRMAWENAKNLNHQYKVWTGGFVDDNPSFQDYTKEDFNIPHYDPSNAGLTDAEKKKKIEENAQTSIDGINKQDVFDELFEIKKTGMPLTSKINELAIKHYGSDSIRNRRKVQGIFDDLEQKYAKETGLEAGEYKEIKTHKKREGQRAGIGEYEFIPEDKRVVEEKIKPKYSGETGPAQLEYDWFLDQKNIAQKWNKSSPSTSKNYAIAIQKYVNDILLKTNNIEDVIQFGKEMKQKGLNLKRKGAFPGLSEQVNKLRSKIENLVYSEKDDAYRRGVIKSINKEFDWANIYITPEIGAVTVQKGRLSSIQLQAKKDMQKFYYKIIKTSPDFKRKYPTFESYYNR